MTVETKSTSSNLAKGRHSFDAELGGSLVAFFNRNITPYPTEQGLKFDPIPVESQKDIMVNVARLYAQQEYDRIMDLIKVLEEQAIQLKRRLEITEMVHSAKYNFQVYHNQIYWLVYDTNQGVNKLVHTGPDQWCTGKPEHYDYLFAVKWLGDYTWIEVKGDNNVD